jgi:hypothetical protein
VELGLGIGHLGEDNILALKNENERIAKKFSSADNCLELEVKYHIMMCTVIEMKTGFALGMDQ